MVVIQRGSKLLRRMEDNYCAGSPQVFPRRQKESDSQDRLARRIQKRQRRQVYYRRLNQARLNNKVAGDLTVGIPVLGKVSMRISSSGSESGT